MIQFHDVSVNYGETAVLNHVNLHIQDGSFTYLCGPSGSGKSSLLKLLYREIDAYTGRITFMDQDLKKMPKWQTRRLVSTIFQSFELLDKKTVFENVALAGQISGMPQPEIRQRTLDLLQKVGLQNKEYRFPPQLSGGEQQRVAIARALLHGPKVLLADEPTGNLDMDNSMNIMELIMELNHTEQLTIIMATHSQELISRYPLKSINIEEGYVMESVNV
ncbi:cell division ATP-binding protein FtsE [Paenibacillus lentus]|uniref:cell division ATP-binding protein FtsE n=1 Tax=Paenibacillus lentus TaxID=1338368 RepID=UPI003647E587